MRINNDGLSEKGLKLLIDLGEIVQKNDRIPPELYPKYNVKRGLRNADGTGVLVGLTEIGEVHSYIMDEGEKVPVEGRLLYRGIDIDDFVEGYQKNGQKGFEECCYLLLFGDLPTKQGLADFKKLLGESRRLPNGFTEDMILKAPSNDIMNSLARSVLAMYSYDQNPEDTSIQNTLRQCIELIARFPTMVAHGFQARSHYHLNQSLHIHTPVEELSTAENILHMIRPDSNYTEQEAEILDLALVLHAEHGGGNNSTFTTHVVTSSGTDIYSTIAAAIGSLKGPQHGGANLKVMGMIEEFKREVNDWDNEDEVAAYIEKILRKDAFDKSGLIYGIGHAVYTISDPRTTLLKQKSIEMAQAKGMEKELRLYMNIEKLTPKVFAKVKNIDKVMCANVDLYSGLVYKMLGLPEEVFTSIFAIGRVAGWCAHRIEELVNGGRIIRPAYKTVIGRRNYTPMEER